MQNETEIGFEKCLEESLKNVSEENKKIAVHQLEELFELVARIFTK